MDGLFHGKYHLEMDDGGIQNGGLTREPSHYFKMDDLGVPLFQETILFYLHSKNPSCWNYKPALLTMRAPRCSEDDVFRVLFMITTFL